MPARRFTVAIMLSFVAAAPLIASDAAPEPERIWPNRAPQAKADADTDTPAIYVYPASGNPTGCGVIINPGGGYHVHAIDHEGAQVARFLNRRGVTAFVLRYRLKRDGYSPDVSLLDAQRAVRYVRHHAERFGVDRDRIGMLGFSAGGHLASRAGVTFDAGDPAADDAVERESCRPDFLVLCYPVTSAALRKQGDYVSTDTRVSPLTPPAFIWFTDEDPLNPMHGVAFYTALRQAGVPAEIHVYSRGKHGLGLAPGDAQVGQWPGAMAQWMRAEGLLTAEPRVAVSGTVTIDGKPLNRGWVRLVPVRSNSRPIASAYLGHGDKGAFKIDAAHGPCAGPHRVIVIEEAKSFENAPTMADAVRHEPVRMTVTDGAELRIEIGTGQ
jgi:acetyl esterase/lipase